ncbi:MAG: hypothetical protein SFY92_05775 [Verrucomicrobiae bacterium]|nr:hypothetical protein [Verrucomicrobiae bacterium]
MKWVDSLERRYKHLAIPGVVRYILVVQAFFLILIRFRPEIYEKMMLVPGDVMRGEVWRLVTFVFTPPTGFEGSWLLFAIFYFLCSWSISDAVEQAMGTFRLNLYILVGMISLFLMSMILIPATSWFLMLSLFFAFATIYPDEIFYLFLIIPVKAKWMALLAAIPLMLLMIFGGWAAMAGCVVAFSNYLIFFGVDLYRSAQQGRKAQSRRMEFEKSRREGVPMDGFHCCVVCGRTDQKFPDLEFRVSSKDGEEYCLDHIAQAPVAKKA